MIYWILILPILLTQVACTKKASDSLSNADQPKTEAQLIERGHSVYLSNCIACHNTDPKKSGSLGPEIYGSSKELLTARILEAHYPNGYNPKRNTSIMRPMPQLKNDIEAMYLYLNK